MIRAVYARTLKPSVSLADFIAAWNPPAIVQGVAATYVVSASPGDDRSVLTTIKIDTTIDKFPALLPDLVHPESASRLNDVVASTELAGVYVDLTSETQLGS